MATPFSAPETDVESQNTREGSVTTDDSVVPNHFLSDDRVPSEDEQSAVNKCIQQLEDRAAHNAVLQAKKIVLQFVCWDYCHMSHEQLNKLHKKEDLYAAATAWVKANVISPENPSKEKNVHSSNGAVLGKDIMEAVWADMAITVLPSWVTKAPSNWGTAAWGKLSANNWRVICPVHLPITLIRLWGDDTPDNRNAMLENFMDLVRAVQYANLRSISQKEIALYEHHISHYMTSFKSLYKDAKVKPIHHAALHYGNVLRGFGPAQTHSAAFYKWHIHAMQSENHNMSLVNLN
ncbi:hypothetical protein EI94DRAFT_1811304 [Lactarius quietus]|nr:hypothetical protein EI94DRAFT_1811304 [Lactarius quietus]